MFALFRRSYSAAFRSLLHEYLPAERRDEKLHWSATDEELCWDFSDKSGECSGSSVASAHMCSLALHAYHDRWDAIAAKKGWRIVAPGTPPALLLLRRTEALMSLEHSRPCVVSPLPLGRCDWDAPGIFWDTPVPALRLEDVPEPHRSAFFAAATVQTCWCPVCSTLSRQYTTTYTSRYEVLRSAWTQLGENASLRAAARAVLPLLEPVDSWKRIEHPELEALSARLTGEGRFVTKLELATMCARAEGSWDDELS
jgi:hypothetical protein